MTLLIKHHIRMYNWLVKKYYAGESNSIQRYGFYMKIPGQYAHKVNYYVRNYEKRISSKRSKIWKLKG